jgi:hypothetical protein
MIPNIIYHEENQVFNLSINAVSTSDRLCTMCQYHVSYKEKCLLFDGSTRINKKWS